MFVQAREEGGDRIVTSASDLTAASACEFAFLRRVDAKLGRDVRVPPDDDPMLARAARLGDAHEERTLDAYRASLGPGAVGQPGGVVEIPRPASMDESELRAVSAQTRTSLEGRAGVVFQATFFDPSQRPPQRGHPEIGFVGFADFLLLGADGAYEVQDAKLARRAKTTALMQLAAYAEQLERIGVPVSPEAVLILGDGSRSRHRVADIAPVFRARRARLHGLLLERCRAVGADGRRESAAAVAWGADGVAACGRCEVCEPEVERTRDPLLIAGIRRAQRDALVAAGADTIDAVAALSAGAGPAERPVAGIGDAALARIAEQAAVQVEAVPGGRPPVRVVDAGALAAIPQPDAGDLFFDFEGDPMYREPGADETARWGLDYLFGMVDARQAFTPLWAHDLEAEKRALLDFLALVAERRRRHPGMHVYHYAAYERAHLLGIAARHGAGEAEVDRLLREHVLVDLYPIVRRALRVGSRSYSIKKLEPLYMGAELRDEGGVTSGAQSVTEYAEASAQLASGDAAERAEGRRRLDAIADYNRYDCVSTLRLRDWLLGIAADHAVAPFPASEVGDEAAPPLELSPVAAALGRHADGASGTELAARDRTAAALAASAIDYHQREQKAFWWTHFARLVDPIEDWADTRDVLIVDRARSGVLADWFVPPRARAERRRLRLRGELAPGSSLRAGGDAYLLYEHPAPFPQPGAAPGARGVRRVRIADRLDDGVIVEEFIGGAERYDALPTALVPGPPPPAGAQKSAIEEWGAELARSLDRGGFPSDPVVDLLRRTPPRAAGGSPLVPPDSAEALAAVDGDERSRSIGAVVAGLRRLERGYVAVQGPPGTGKTYLAARVIRRLVERHGWRVGVVAQSHRVVENVLEGAVAAGLDPALVGKVPQGGGSHTGGSHADGDGPAYTVLPKNGHLRFALAHREAGRGCVIGGTAWDFSNETRFERRGLDLLVIDEAGQFSLAPTIAASVAAERLLLLGDPQQLPQVSQGSHPEPVDTSALGWLLGEHDTVPDDLGYFLAESRRMRPELADVVSELAYEGRLRAHPTASRREATGAGPAGLVWHPVSHAGNSTSSEEEAEEVVRIVGEALRGRLRDGDRSRELTEEDLIVVAAYNAQVECVAEALAAAGHRRVRVGTVDRFQGQEAAIAVVSLAASSPDDVPRGLEFLLMRGRLNVAVSRAQWATHLVSSDRLGDGLPGTAEGLAALSGYLRLLERRSRANVEAW
ncbi:bifunctional RecB family nuclease/DEAD/DEAH box helicase [Leucobacter sp. wl10]|uniref:TM0106 family RecB-like putative nuclease n=1 Tax=Leucobacter sp. wl10 TaxID=2304677 RepID=UPI000E5B2638|nr:bifunctional RecB family nuclease/DEAD/DEAH box helicase [Leucobacter sp. wl10]RGE20054.1 TM0106 family RecB-like putative nuclease [Leucobacter sp. wl10]